MTFTKSSLTGLNGLTKGYDRDLIFGVFSKSMVGKTVFLLQEAFWFAKVTKKKVLIIDTEGDEKSFIREWGGRFSKRFGVGKEEIKVKVLKNIKELLVFHGVTIKSDISKKGSKLTSCKVSKVVFNESPIMKYIVNNNVGVVVYDSITLPFKEFGANTPNLPARSDVVGFLYNRMLNVIDKKVLLLTSHHLSSNPTQPFAEEKMQDGNLIYHFSKVIVQLKEFGAKKMKDYRMLILIRFPNKPKFSDIAYLKMTDDGIFDVPEEEIIELRERKENE